VCKAIGSPDVIGSLEIGAAWAALPETYRLPDKSWLPDWRMALVLMDQLGKAKPGDARLQIWSMQGNPHHDAVATLKGRYPTLPTDTRWAPKEMPDEIARPGSWGVVVEWSDSHDLDAIAPDGSSGRNLIPTLPGQAEILSPLMTWWLLLFGLSVFARYHPGLWLRALQVDQSPAAVPLEAVLDRALGALPRLVYDGALGTTVDEGAE
jgi:hypothetical protein